MNAFSFNKLQGLEELLGLWRLSSPALTEKEIWLPGGMTRKVTLQTEPWNPLPKHVQFYNFGTVNPIGTWAVLANVV